MPTYIELNSQCDPFPSSAAEAFMTTKREIKDEIDNRLNHLIDLAGDDCSLKYYRQLEDILKRFMRKLELTVLPHHLEDWWRYTYEISHKGIRLCVEHIDSMWIDADTGEYDEETVDQVFPLISVDAKMLTVDEYAKLYGVEQVTVRQWIRRCKLREAEKAGKEWRISELTPVPSRGRHETAAYKWISDLTDVPPEFTKIRDYNQIEILKREVNVTKDNPEITAYASLSSRRENSRTERLGLALTDELRERLEYYLISNPDVLYTGSTRTFAVKDNVELTIDLEKYAEECEEYDNK